MKEGWISNRLGAITTKIGSGAAPRGGEESYKESGTPLIRSLNVPDWGFKKAKLARIDDAQAAQLSNVISPFAAAVRDKPKWRKSTKALDDLLLPYKIDLSEMASLTHPALLDHIRRVGMVFYEKSAMPRAPQPT